MRFDSHRKFRRDLTRLRTLYEASTEAYRELHERGKKVLRQPSHPHNVEFEIGSRKIKRPWKTVTYHARDVYPKTLRSTILVQTVSLFEVFITSTMEDLAQRDTDWLKDDKRIDKTHAEILTIEQREGFEHFILRKAISEITRGSLEQKRVFFRNKFGIELASEETTNSELTEIHDRRNIFVHRGGFPDAIYLNRYPLVNGDERRRLPVSVDYLERAFTVLESSAWHICSALKNQYPSTIQPRYVHGTNTIAKSVKLIYHISIRTFDNQTLSTLSANDFDICPNLKLSDILIWSSAEGRKVNFILSGEGEQIGELVKLLVAKKRAGELEILNSFRINRSQISI